MTTKYDDIIDLARPAKINAQRRKLLAGLVTLASST